jgi:DNA-binding response OmpR family regulator
MDIDNSVQQDSTGVKTLLIVEDDEAIGSFLMQALQQETSYQVILTTDGFEALKMLRTLKPDLLILDYWLPGMNGLELYDTIHAVQALEHIPVLIVSAETAIIRKELEARHLPHLQKPFDLADLLAAIERL